MQLAIELSLFFSFHFLHSKCHQPSLPNRHVTLKKASDSQTLIFFSGTLGMYEILSGPVSLKTMLFRSPWPPWKVPRPVCATSQFSVSARQDCCYMELYLLKASISFLPFSLLHFDFFRWETSIPSSEVTGVQHSLTRGQAVQQPKVSVLGTLNIGMASEFIWCFCLLFHSELG